MRPFLRRFHALRGLQLFALHYATLANVATANAAYPDTSISLSGNTTITPGATPANTTSINVSTSTNFKGTFSASPTTGVVTVTDAHPAGSYTVMVTAFGPGGTTTKTFTLTVTNGCTGTDSFNNAADVRIGPYPFSVAVGDFNGDGKQDLAVADAGFVSTTVSIRLGDGLGGFSGSTNVSVGSQPDSVAIGDFNGDGKQDLAAANHLSGSVSIRLGDGSGGFSGFTNVNVHAAPVSVAIGDFNGDGKQDLAVANESLCCPSNTVSIRLGDGLGGFTSPAVPEVNVGDASRSVAIGDFNGDGKQDLAVANGNWETVSIRLGDGLGGFTSPAVPEVSVGSGPWSVAIGDFNGDGKQDLAAANLISGTVSIRLGDGLDGFTSPAVPEVRVGVYPSSVAIGDFNGDGKQDLAVATNRLNDPSDDTVSIRLGDGLGGFSGSHEVSMRKRPNSIAIGDFNGDGKQDLAVSNQDSSAVSIWLGVCIPGPSPTPINISGTVSYCSNSTSVPVPNVTLILTGSRSGSTSSDGSGNYTFSSLPFGASYTVTPTKPASTPGATGINTADVIATKRHFLGLGTPFSGCRLAAADVNGDTAVNTADVFAIQLFSVGLTFGAPANVGKYQFSPANRTYPAVGSNQTAQNYDTLVFGDVVAPFVE